MMNLYYGAGGAGQAVGGGMMLLGLATWLVWLVVGILLVAWLWKNLMKK